MSRRRFILPEREKADRLAATAPDTNAWVSANAGSGKTSILRDRVMRLLLDNVPPDRILCLTFTKAAAAEMQERIFRALGHWTSLPDAELAEVLEALTGAEDFARRRAVLMLRARQLFAEAIETPGGLKIQTIHAFAERILHLFPIEAGVPFDFAVIDEGDARQLKAEARRQVIDDALEHRDSALGRAFVTISEAVGMDGFSKAIESAIQALAGFRNRWPDRSTAQAMDIRAYSAMFGVAPDENEAKESRRLLETVGDRTILAAWAEALAGVPAKRDTSRTLTALKAYLALAPRSDRHGEAERLSALLSVFLTQKNALREHLHNAPFDTIFPAMAAEIDAAGTTVPAFLEQRSAIRAFNRSRALRLFADQALDAYQQAKDLRGALDYDDLISRLSLMLSEGRSAWVMLKLDAAIEHILVDEAQDTTPQMWDIIRALADDFFSGEGQGRFRRSLFVVGDEKQSIYSFQGARPEAFEQSRQHFMQKMPKALSARISDPVPLRYSFRSSGDVLAAIDAVFSDDRAKGLSASGAAIEHIAADDRFAGVVELWPVIEKSPVAAPVDPDAPVDAPREDHPSLRAARIIAETIVGWLQDGTCHASDGTPIRPDDILILAQHRNPFFNAMLRELRRCQIPVAGADRLRLSHDIGVLDLVAIANAAVFPDDDLTLATALKSPFFGLDDQALEHLCRGRSGRLRAAIAGHATDDPLACRLDHALARLEALARHLAPYDFFASLLIGPGFADPDRSGRAHFYARLGMDAEDAISAFLNDALEFTVLHPPSLPAFLAANAARDREIKRDLETGAGQVRVMTIHASKGLEARIVILGDALLEFSKSHASPCFITEDAGNELLLWAGARSDEPLPMRERRETHKRAQFEEYRRLLYVAMTRAEERLIIAAHSTSKAKAPDAAPKKPPKDPPDPAFRLWHRLIEDAFVASDRVERVESPFFDQPILRWQSQRVAHPPVNPEPPPANATQLALPDWLTRPAPRDPPLPPPLRPSQAGHFGEPDPPSGRDRLDPRQRGILIHRLCEVLPRIVASARLDAGIRLIRRERPDLAPEAAAETAAIVVALLEHNDIAAFFDATSLAEVAIAGTVRLQNGLERRVIGRIDRLCVREGRVDLLDIKTGMPRSGAAAMDLHRQMALYGRALAAAFPGHSIVTHLLWSRLPRLDTLDQATLDDAFAGITGE